MNTYQFAFRGRTRYIDAPNIFSAMVAFHALHSEQLNDLDELQIHKLS